MDLCYVFARYSMTTRESVAGFLPRDAMRITYYYQSSGVCLTSVRHTRVLY